jgi:hypothetical protein
MREKKVKKFSVLTLVIVLVFVAAVVAASAAPLRGYVSFWNSYGFSPSSSTCGPWEVLSGGVVLPLSGCDSAWAENFRGQSWASIKHEFSGAARLEVEENNFLKCYVIRGDGDETTNTCRWRIYTEESDYEEYVQPLCEVTPPAINCAVVVPEDGKVYDVRLGWRYMDVGDDYEVEQVQYYYWDYY